MGLKETVVAVIIFSIILNLSAGVVGKLPAFTGITDMGGLTYSPRFNDAFVNATSGINNTIQLGGDEVASTGAFNSVMDFLSIKTYVKMFGILDSYMYGFVNMLANIFQGPLNSAGTGLGSLLFGGLKGILFVGYIFLMFTLFTGRDIEGKSQ